MGFSLGGGSRLCCCSLGDSRLGSLVITTTFPTRRQIDGPSMYARTYCCWGRGCAGEAHSFDVSEERRSHLFLRRITGFCRLGGRQLSQSGEWWTWQARANFDPLLLIKLQKRGRKMGIPYYSVSVRQQPWCEGEWIQPKSNEDFIYLKCDATGWSVEGGWAMLGKRRFRSCLAPKLRKVKRTPISSFHDATRLIPFGRMPTLPPLRTNPSPC